MKYCILSDNLTRVGDFDTEAEADAAKAEIHESWNPKIVRLTDVIPIEMTKQAPLRFKCVWVRQRWWHKALYKFTRFKTTFVWLSTAD